jgi:hypothetical protein
MKYRMMIASLPSMTQLGRIPLFKRWQHQPWVPKPLGLWVSKVWGNRETHLFGKKATPQKKCRKVEANPKV